MELITTQFFMQIAPDKMQSEYRNGGAIAQEDMVTHYKWDDAVEVSGQEIIDQITKFANYHKAALSDVMLTIESSVDDCG